MKLKTVRYNSSLLKPRSAELKEFKKEISDKGNIIYLFYKNSKCLYIGETSTSLEDRCYKNTPKHAKKIWFKQSNRIHIIKLDKKLDNIARQALESAFILSHRPRYNKKA